MNIGMILNAPYPPDLRVKKETDALVKAGFKIFLLCLRQEKESYREELAGVVIERIDAGKNNHQLALRDAIMSLTFRHPEFLETLPRWVNENKIAAIHVHDLPLAGTALSVRKLTGINVIVDLHENYPEALRTWFLWKKGWLIKLKNRIFMDPGRWTTLEKRAVGESDYVIAVIEEMKERLISNHGVNPEKIIVIPNTEEKSFANQPIDSTVYVDFENKFRIVYSGGIGPHRGIDTAIEGMGYLKDFTDIELIIIGSGSKDVIDYLQKLSRNLGVSEHVHFLGHQSFQKFYSFMHLADVNVIPHKSNAHTDNTIPHKLFQSMMSGRPVIVSSSAPLKRIISENQAGLIFEAGDAQDFARRVIELYKNRQLGDALGKNGRHATYNGSLNWDHDQQTLVGFYRNLLKGK